MIRLGVVDRFPNRNKALSSREIFDAGGENAPYCHFTLAVYQLPANAMESAKPALLLY
jgi:hypothetical protein